MFGRGTDSSLVAHSLPQGAGGRRWHHCGLVKPRQIAASLLPSGSRTYAAASLEGHHGSVAARSRLLIERFSNPEREFAGAIFFVDPPACGDAIPLGIAGDAALHAKRRQHRIVESSGTLKIIGAKVDVGVHRAFFVADWVAVLFQS